MNSEKWQTNGEYWWLILEPPFWNNDVIENSLYNHLFTLLTKLRIVGCAGFHNNVCVITVPVSR